MDTSGTEHWLRDDDQEAALETRWRYDRRRELLKDSLEEARESWRGIVRENPGEASPSYRVWRKTEESCRALIRDIERELR